MQLIFEIENNNKLLFLDVLLIKTSNTIDTKVYGKPTNTNIFLSWSSYAPVSWKKGTLRGTLRDTKRSLRELRTVWSY